MNRIEMPRTLTRARRWRWAAGTALLASVLIFGACGDGENGTPTEEPTVSATASSTATSTSTPMPSETATESATPSDGTPDLGSAFPGLPLDQITDLEIDGDTVTVTSQFSSNDESDAQTLCDQLLVFVRFTSDPAVVVLASDGSTELASCS
ncbi:MAG: hypothetical protein R3C39_15065 [Dehalococcoidia bacterium]